MSETAYFDVVCFGGPWDGVTHTLREDRTGWEVWRPVIEMEPLRWRGEDEEGPAPITFGREYVGSYVVESDRKRAFWIQAYRGTL